MQNNRIQLMSKSQKTIHRIVFSCFNNVDNRQFQTCDIFDHLDNLKSYKIRVIVPSKILNHALETYSKSRYVLSAVVIKLKVLLGGAS